MLRKAIPVLTHVDNLSDMKIDMSTQERLLSQIDSTADSIDRNVENIKLGQNHEVDSLVNINMDTTYLKNSVGLPADAASSNTVIGLLKSIANKL